MLFLFRDSFGKKRSSLGVSPVHNYVSLPDKPTGVAVKFSRSFPVTIAQKIPLLKFFPG